MLPVCDFQDVTYLRHKYKAKQFAAEFSQEAYETMLSQDYAIGSYTAGHVPLRSPTFICNP